MYMYTVMYMVSRVCMYALDGMHVMNMYIG